MTPKSMRFQPLRAGFSLIELSIVMLIIAMVVGGGLTMLVKSLEKNQFELTQFRMQTIQKALLEHRKTFNRLPCPADPTVALNSANFGLEAANPGRCLGGAPGAYFSQTATVSGTFISGSPIVTVSTTNLSAGMYVENGSYIPSGTTIRSIDSATQLTLTVNAVNTGTGTITYVTNVAGAVPIKALDLPDDFAVDGWGRRFNYVVNTPLTASNAFTKGFVAVPISDVRQRIRIVTTGTTDKITNAVYALISYGKNGHGAFPRNGAAALYSASSVNTDELINCDCNSVATIVGTVKFDRIVQKLPTENPSNRLDSFDDLVVFGTRQDLRTSME